MSSVGLPNNLEACLFTVSLLVVLCTISIFCLVAVSVDRYWAILHPMGYSRNVRTKTALVIISCCWVAGVLVGLLPLMGWRQDRVTPVSCFFLHVMDYNYLVFLYFGTIITPACLLVAFYAHIYTVVLKQLRQIVVMNPECGSASKGLSSGGMVRMLGVHQTNEVKATQNLAVIVLFFMICWIPLYTINCIIAFHKDFKVNSTFMLACIILSHVNSACNPLLYAYNLRDFRAALKNFFCRLFKLEQTYCDQFRPRYPSDTNFSQCRPRNSSAKFCYRNKIPVEPQFDVNTNAAQAPEKIWNITEDSGNCSSSNDSLTAVNTAIHGRSPVFVHLTTECERSGDAYYDAPNVFEMSDKYVNFKGGKNVDFSSRRLFEETRATILKEPIMAAGSTKSFGILSRYGFVNSILKNQRKLDRSLSDGGHSDSTKHLNKAIAAEYFSAS
ncbi:adenosine receptor A1 isoform X2 [Cylas formicarius]|nr:adenosine receptor A1 isoform X2 [Cylas formicarius]